MLGLSVLAPANTIRSSSGLIALVCRSVQDSDFDPDAASDDEAAGLNAGRNDDEVIAFALVSLIVFRF